MTRLELMAKMDRVDDEWSSTLYCNKCRRGYTWYGQENEGLEEWVSSHEHCYKQDDPNGVTSMTEKGAAQVTGGGS